MLQKQLNISIFLSVGLISSAGFALSDSEADAIIAAQEQAKIARQEARIAELEKAEVISEGRGVLPSGQEVIVREVKPPSVGALLAKPAPVTKQLVPNPEQISAWQEQAAKEARALMLSATVYDHEVTRLSWSYDNEKFAAYTNANFNYLRGVHTTESDTHRYSFFMNIGNASRATNAYPGESIPLPSAFSPERSEHILIQGDANNEAALGAIAALLEHYDNNWESLKIDLQRREALAAAQKRYDAAHPEEPEPFVMQFWVPEQKNKKAGE